MSGSGGMVPVFSLLRDNKSCSEFSNFLMSLDHTN